jgi:tellurite methyltransferase
MGWQELDGHEALASGNVLDLRDWTAFAAGHLRGAACFAVLADGCDDLSDALPGSVLPPRREPLLVYGDDAARVEQVVFFLRDRGRVRTDGALLDGDSVPPDWWVSGGDSAALWRPSSFLRDNIALLPSPGFGPVLDLGCGGGRAAVWLAQRGYDVTAVDHLAEALDLVDRLARLHDVRVTTLRADLTRTDQVPPGPWGAILSFRFLERPLLDRLPGLLKPGGVVVLRTFRWVDGDERLPRRRYCLEPGEASRLFPRERFEMLRAVEDHFDDRRPAAGYLARLRDDSRDGS